MLKASLETLVAAFNRGSLDVPAGFFSPQTTFSLNGRSYESILGGSPEDPLIRLLARGAGAYRTAAKALQYALQQPTIVIDTISSTDAPLVIATVRVAGTLRDSGERFESGGALKLTWSDDVVSAIDVECSDADLRHLAKARRG